MKLPRPRLAAGTILVCCALALTACGANKDSVSKGHSFTAAWAATPENVDPEVFEGTKSQQFAAAVGETLFDWDVKEGQGSIPSIDDIKPNLAADYKVLDNGTRIRITLRSGVKSATGHTLTADDVKWTFDRWIESNKVLGSILLPLASVDVKAPIEVVDSHTFDYKLTTPSALALPILTWPGASILDSKTVKAHSTTEDPLGAKWLSTHTATFGPYTLDTFKPGQSLTLKANTSYWKGTPYYTAVTLQAIPDSGNRDRLLLTGAVDYAQDLTFAEADALKDEKKVQLFVSPSVNRGTLDFDTSDARFSDAHVRYAISLAINRAGIADSLLYGVGKPAVSCASSGMPIEVPSNALPPSGDVAAAKAELAKSKYPSGFDFNLAVNASRPGPYSPDMARLIKNDLAAIGIVANIKVIQSQTTFQDGVNKGKYESWIYSDGPVVPDVGYDWYQKLYSKSFVNNANYNNPNFDEQLRSILRLAPTSAERVNLVSRVCSDLLADAPMLWLVELPDIRAIAPNVAGYRAYPHFGVRFSELSGSGS